MLFKPSQIRSTFSPRNEFAVVLYLQIYVIAVNCWHTVRKAVRAEIACHYGIGMFLSSSRNILMPLACRHCQYSTECTHFKIGPRRKF